MTKGRTFFWRKNSLSPWKWLVLELLLKRTRAEAVEKFFPTFIAKYHGPRTVVETTNLELTRDLKHLGLGKQRCIALKLIARDILERFDGQVPRDRMSLASLPHVGLYISNAVACFCYGQRSPVVDTNVSRVLSRVYGLRMPKDAREQSIWALAERVLPENNWREYNYGLLDIGATVCTTKAPKCPQCCLEGLCAYATRKQRRRHVLPNMIRARS
jgi:A/G-specific adenine glycosylase